MAIQLGYPKAAAMAISTEERVFFVAMGERIAAFRKTHNITQVQLAEALGVSQQTLQSYEVGRRRIPVSALPVVAHTLSVSLDELFGESKPAARGRVRAVKHAARPDSSASMPTAMSHESAGSRADNCSPITERTTAGASQIERTERSRIGTDLIGAHRAAQSDRRPKS
jgi:transcriptional regulator with XRE-family HTH domain